MNEKYGETPQQRLGRALDQPMQNNSELVRQRMIIEPGKEPYFVPLDAIGLKDAFDRLCAELIKDKEPGSYYYAWQSHIAMAFYDAAAKYSMENGIHWDQNDARITHEIANTAAKNFLDSLCNQANINSKKL